jgi:hypothetical protein
VCRGILAYFPNFEQMQDILGITIRLLFSDTTGTAKKKNASNNSSIVASVLISAVIFLPSLCLAAIGDTNTDTQSGGRDL